MSLGMLLLILFACLFCESFFTGTEIAVVHSDKLILRGQARRGSRRAAILLGFLKNPARFFSTTLLGTNLSTVTASVCTTYYIVEHYGESYSGFGLVLAPIILIFGEIVPKSIYQHHANRLVLKLAFPLQFFSWLFSPLVFLLAKMTNSLLGRIVKQSKEAAPVTREELEHLIYEESAKWNVEEIERRPHRNHLISKIFELEEVRVCNIMIPLVEVSALPMHSTREEVLAMIESSGHSRIPVFERKITNIVGAIHSIDLLLADPDDTIAKMVRKAYFVPEEMLLDELLVTMKRNQEPMAIVVDEFGGSSGIVTFEDLVEQVIGEIQDEYDDQKPLFSRLGKNRYLVHGRMEVVEANAKLKLDIPEGDYETVAGFLISHVGRIPKVGTEIIHDSLRFIICSATEKAIHEVEIRLGTETKGKS